MTRSIVVAVALALSAIALPAMADEANEARPSFPMPAAEFVQHANARLEKGRAKLEERITEKNVPADKAQAMRTRFEANATTMRDEVAKVAADGVVTKEEAREVHELARTLHPHHHHGEKGREPPPALNAS